MPDLYPFKDIPGLLSPEQSGNVRSNAMLSAAAALLKSGGWSSMPQSPFAQLGQGLEGFLAGNKAGNDDALKQELLKGQIMQRHLAMAKFGLEANALGLNPSQFIPGGIPGAGAGPAAGGAPGGGGGGIPRAPSVGGAPPVGGGSSVPALPPGLFSPAPMAQTPPPSLGPAPLPAPPQAAAPPAPLPGTAQSVLRNMPGPDKALLLGSDKIGETVSKLAVENAKRTPDQKNAAASGVANPLDYNLQIKNGELTPDQKAAKGAGFNSVPEYLSHVEATKAQGAAIGKRMADVIDAGGTHARATKNNLNLIEDALNHGGDNVFTGPYADEALKVKQAAKNLGYDVSGVPESEIISKLNAFLAGEATKQISSRPAQFEFQTYLKNNPGLMTSAEGTKKLINIMRQTTDQNIKLGRLAMKSKPGDWGDTEEQFYNDPKNAITSPFTGQALGLGGSQPEAAPGATPPAAAPAAPVKVTSQADWAALKPGTLYMAPDGSIRTKGGQ